MHRSGRSRMPPTAQIRLKPDATEVFLTTSSLTKSYGLSGLRCGWILSSAAVADRLRRARDVIDGTGSIVAERLATLAFSQLDRLIARSAALLAVNGPLVREFLHARPELEVVEPRGGTVVFPRLAWRRRLQPVRGAPAARARDGDRAGAFLRGAGALPRGLRRRDRRAPRRSRCPRRGARREGVVGTESLIPNPSPCPEIGS